MAKSIEKQALGRVAKIGQLYNAITDDFIHGQSLFQSKLKDEMIDVTKLSGMSIDFVDNETMRSKFEVFGVDPDLQLSVLSGLTKINKTNSYFIREKISELSSKEMQFFYSNRTVSEEIWIKAHRKDIDKDLLQNTEATHVVIAIDWGYNCFFSCEYKTDDETTIMEKVNSQVKAMRGILDNEENESYQNLDTTNFSYHLDSDIEIQSEIPMTFEQFINYLKKIQPTRIEETNGGKGVPLTYYMLPISDIGVMCGVKTRHEKNVPLIDRPVFEMYIHKFMNINRLKESTLALIKDYKKNRSIFSDERVKNVRGPYNQLIDLENKLKEMLKEVLLDIRSGKKTNKVAEQTLQTFFEEFSQADIEVNITRYRDILKEKISLLDKLNNFRVNLVCSPKELNEFVKAKKCYVLYINDDLMERPEFKKNKELFFHLLQTYKDDEETFCVFDSSKVHCKGTEIKIEMYQSGKLEYTDYWEVERENLQKSLVKYTGNSMENPNGDERGDPVRLPCPHCKGAVMEWFCSECKDFLHYNRKNKSVFCHCSVHTLSELTFRCTDISKHGLRYSVYEEIDLIQDMENLKPDSEINILILGETGVGKSTWINSFANYLSFESFTEAENHGPMVLIPSQFQLEGKKITIGKKNKIEDQRVGQSATQFPYTHSINVGNGYVIRLIDTPGIGDVRGIEHDKINFENILSHLRHFDKIHAICILLMSNQSRLKISFRFCISELLVHLHKSAASNIIFCYTHSRETFYRAGDTMSILKKHLDQQNVKISLGKKNQFFFDSESFRCLAIIKNGQKVNEEDRKIYTASWDRSCIESSRLMEQIKKMKPHDTKATIAINRARQIIIFMMKPLATISQNIERNVQFASDERKKIDAFKLEETELTENLSFMGTIVKINPLPYPRTVCTHKSCVKYVKETSSSGASIIKTNYITHCHDHCYLENIKVETKGEKGLQYCKAFTKSISSCNTCKHSYLEHQHIDYELEEVFKTLINNEIQKEIDSKKDLQKEKEKCIASLDKLVKELRKEKEVVIKTCAEYSCFLKECSITTFNDAMEGHFQQLIETSEENGSDRRDIENLKAVLEKYKEERKAIEDFMEQSVEKKNKIKKPTDVQAKLMALFQLEHNGSQLKEIFEKIESIRQKHSQYLHSPYYLRKGGWIKSKKISNEYKILKNSKCK